MEMLLQPGTLYDDNRAYIPYKVVGTDLVVNESGNNSIPYPKRLTEHTAVLTDGLEDTWYEYVPKSYDGSIPVPLVISNHGGLMNGWAQAIYSSWTILAEREGFICVFPNAHENQMWAIEGIISSVDIKKYPPPMPISVVPDDYRENHDLNFELALIQHIQQKYNIDAGRIYMHGMSMGHLMTDQFARHYGFLLAGAAGSGAASKAKDIFTDERTPINDGGPLAIWQSHPECNGTIPDPDMDFMVQKSAREYWHRVNGCNALPELRIDGEHNLLFYHGEHADCVYLETCNRDHGQTLDEAFLYWDYLFSGVRRDADGKLVRTKPYLPMQGDAFSLAFTEGCAYAWHNNQIECQPVVPIRHQKLKYHGLNGGTQVRGEYLCVSLRYMSKAVGAKYYPGENGRTAAVLLPDGTTACFASGSIGCMLGSTMRSMYCEAIFRDGELLVSAEWFLGYNCRLWISKKNGVLYATDHPATISAFTARILKDCLAGT